MTQGIRGIRKRNAAAVALVGMIALVLFAGSMLVSLPEVSANEGEGPQAHVNLTDFGYKNKDVHGEPLKDGSSERMAPPLVAQMINFVIFLGLLIFFAGPKIRQHLNKQHSDVKTALEEAAVMKAEAAAKLEEYKKRIADIDREVDELVTTIKSEAEAERTRIVAEAEQQSASLRRDAEERISASIGRAKNDLESEVVAAAIAAAEGALTKHINDTDHQSLVEQFIVELDSDGSTPSGSPSGPSGSSGGGGHGGAGNNNGGADNNADNNAGGSSRKQSETERQRRESEVDEGWA